MSPSVTQVRPPEEAHQQQANEEYASLLKSRRRGWAEGRQSVRQPGSGLRSGGWSGEKGPEGNDHKRKSN